MKKILITILVCLFILPFILRKPAMATDTRARGIGLIDVEKDRWMIDGMLTYTYNNPAYLGINRNRIFIEYNTSNNYVGGLLISATRKIHIGLFSGFEIDDDAFGSSSSFLSMLDFTGITNGTYIVGGNDALSLSTISDQYFTFMMSFDVRNFSIGFRIGWAGAMESEENKVSGLNYDKSGHAVLLGIGTLVKLRRGISFEFNPDISIYLINSVVEDTGAGVKATMETDGAMDMNIPIRFNYKVTGSNVLHALFGFKYINRSTKGTASGSGGDQWERVSYNIYFGISDEWRVHRNVLIFAGLQLDWIGKAYKYVISTTVEETEDVVIIPIHLGLEGTLPKGWTVRCGLKHNLISYTKTIDKSNAAGEIITSSLNSANLDGAMGLSWRIGNLSFDWSVNISIFRDGPHFISGISNPFSSDFALTYIFNSSMPASSRGGSSAGRKKKFNL